MALVQATAAWRGPENHRIDFRVHAGAQAGLEQTGSDAGRTSGGDDIQAADVAVALGLVDRIRQLFDHLQPRRRDHRLFFLGHPAAPRASRLELALHPFGTPREELRLRLDREVVARAKFVAKSCEHSGISGPGQSDAY